jgi:hypothetical protein
MSFRTEKQARAAAKRKKCRMGPQPVYVVYDDDYMVYRVICEERMTFEDEGGYGDEEIIAVYDS